MLAHQLHVVQHGDHRAPLAVPALHHAQQVGAGARVDAVEGLVEQDELRVLQQQSREQHALELAHRELADAAPLETRQADRGERLARLGDERGVDGAEGAAPRPVTERDEIEHAEREAAVDVRLLRQVGDAAGKLGGDLDAPGAGRQAPRERFQQAALAGAVGADHGGERARREFAAEVMHRRVALVRHREVDDADGVGAHGARSAKAQATAAHSSTSAASATATRAPAPRINTLAPASAAAGRSCAWSCA